MTAPARVLVIDDHPLFRAGLIANLNHDPRLEVVGESGSPEEGLRLARREHPDLVLVDLKMPGTGGIALARRLLAELPQSRVVILTSQDSQEAVRECLEIGVHGFVVKTATPDHVVGALLTVLGGGLVAPRAARAVPRQRLTAREIEVLRLLAAGRANKEIARELGISERTVRNHIAHTYEKVGVESRAAAVRYAIRQGLVEA